MDKTLACKRASTVSLAVVACRFRLPKGAGVPKKLQPELRNNTSFPRIQKLKIGSAQDTTCETLQANLQIRT